MTQPKAWRWSRGKATTARRKPPGRRTPTKRASPSLEVLREPGVPAARDDHRPPHPRLAVNELDLVFAGTEREAHRRELVDGAAVEHDGRRLIGIHDEIAHHGRQVES